MRLSPSEIEAITTCAKMFFGARVSVRLFGSRTDDNAAGGDIDLYIEPEDASFASLRNELGFRAALQDVIGEQRIDVVMRAPADALRPIDRIARETGVPLP